MNTETCRTVHAGGCAEITEKKSRFIATVRPVSSEEEALAFIEQMKKKYWDARHNCSAYVIGANNEFSRCSDDGEPAKTAGRPMLDVLLSEGIHDVAVVVTRYFGGVLLGTGGLVRAYQAAVKAGLDASSIIEKRFGRRLTVTADYTDFGKLQHIAASEQIPLLETEYTDKVTVTLFVTEKEEARLVEKLTEATNARATITPGEESYFAILDGKLLLFAH